MLKTLPKKNDSIHKKAYIANIVIKGQESLNQKGKKIFFKMFSLKNKNIVISGGFGQNCPTYDNGPSGATYANVYVVNKNPSKHKKIIKILKNKFII